MNYKQNSKQRIKQKIENIQNRKKWKREIERGLPDLTWPPQPTTTARQQTTNGPNHGLAQPLTPSQQIRA
jgi:hypothetical protein